MRAGCAVLLGAFLVLPGCLTEAPLARVRAGDLVVVDLQAWDAQGREARNASGLHAVAGGHVPVRLPAGWDAGTTETLPPAVQAALLGEAAGAVVDTPLVPASQAYGDWRAERTIRAPERDLVPAVVQVPAGALAQGPDGSLRAAWANATWDAERVAANGTLASVRLLGGPAPGAVFELPDYWNAGYQLWRSRFLGIEGGNLSVQHLAEPGRVALVGGQPYRVTSATGTVVADGNPPLAGMSLRFRATLRGLAFAGGGAFPQAPDARLFALDGAALNLSDLRGRPVLLDFYATWCLTCKQQAPVLARAHEQFPQLAIVSVTIDPADTPDRVRAFAADAMRASLAAWGRALPANWTWAFDPTAQAVEAYSVTGIPREVLLDGEGRVRATSVGFHPYDELERDVLALGPGPQ